MSPMIPARADLVAAFDRQAGAITHAACPRRMYGNRRTRQIQYFAAGRSDVAFGPTRVTPLTSDAPSFSRYQSLRLEFCSLLLHDPR